MLGLMLGLMLAMLGTPASARSVLELDAAKQPVALSDWGEYWINSSGESDPDHLLAKAMIPWAATPLRGIYPLGANQKLWIRFTVPPAPDAERWVLEIPYPALDLAFLYTLDKAGQWIEQRAGDLTAVNQWSMPHRQAMLNLNFNAEEPTYYMLRIENAQGFSAPIRFVTAPFVLREEQKVSLFLGAYFGMALLGCLIGLGGAVWLKDSAYLYYAGCAALVGLTQAVASGVAGLHLWPNAPFWADRSMSVLGVGGLLLFLRLNASIIYLQQRSKRLNALVWVGTILGVVVALALLLTPSAMRLTLVIPYLLVVMVVVVATNVWAWRHGDRRGGWLLLATTPLVLGLCIAIARYVQWLPLSFATEHGILSSMAFLLVTILGVLAVRSQHQRENQRRIQGLDRIDPATGLLNSTAFFERLIRLSARSDRLKQHSAVMIVELVNTEQIQRDYGRKVADEMPLRVAARLLSTARDIDSAARLSERRFGMLVEGPFTHEEAAMLGPRIIARCLMPYKDLHIDCTAQVRVAYALVPFKGQDAQGLVAKLEARLASAFQRDDKRAVFMVNDDGIMENKSGPDWDKSTHET